MQQITVIIVKHVEYLHHKHTVGRAQAQQLRNINVHCAHLHTTIVGQAQALRQHNINVQHVHNFGIILGQTQQEM